MYLSMYGWYILGWILIVRDVTGQFEELLQM